MLPLGNRMPPAEAHQLDLSNLCVGKLHRWYADRSHFVWSEQSRPTQSSTKLNSPTAQHYGIRRRTGFPPKYLQRNGDTHMRSSKQRQQAGSMRHSQLYTVHQLRPHRCQLYPTNNSGRESHSSAAGRKLANRVRVKHANRGRTHCLRLDCAARYTGLLRKFTE